MDFSSLARAEREAGRLLERFQMSRAPVDVEAIARHLGLEVRYQKFQADLSGVLVKQSSGSTIGINSGHAKTRQRFSIAHEIGHFWLNHAGDMFIDESQGQATVVFRDNRSAEGTDLQEMEANRFAAALLMPASLLIDSARRNAGLSAAQSKKEMLAKLSREYRVSAQAMEIRMSSLGLLVSA